MLSCVDETQRCGNDFFIGWASRDVDGGTEASEARSAPERRGEWGLGRGAVAPPQYGGLEAMPPENFSKSTLKWHILRHFCKLKWSLLQWRQGRIRKYRKYKMVH